MIVLLGPGLRFASSRLRVLHSSIEYKARDGLLLESSWVRAAIDEEVLPGDVRGVHTAHERAQRAELVDGAEAPGRHSLDPCLPHFLYGLALLLGGEQVGRLQPVRV